MRFLVACVLVLATAADACAHLKPEEVGVVAMSASANSRRLAEHYLKARAIPANQLLLLDGKPGEDLSRQEWESRVRPAIHKWLTDNGFDTKLRCLVTCQDVPLRIGRRAPDAPLVVARREYLNRTRENRVSQIVGLIRVLDALAPNQPPPERPPLPPSVSLQELTNAFDASLKAAEQRMQALGPVEKQRPVASVVEKVFVLGGGVNVVARSLTNRAERGQLSPELAQRLELFKGQLAGLQEGIQAISALPDSTARDAQLLALLQRAGGLLGTLQWIDREREQLQKNETYSSFDSELSLIFWPDYPLFRWQPNLMHYSYDALGPSRRATMMVSRLAAPTLELALKLVDTAVAVERTGLTGKVYLDARGFEYNAKNDQRGSYGDYDQSIRDLAERLQKHTHLITVLDNKAELFAPGSCPDAALYCGWYSLGKYVDAFQWRPGAVGYHPASMEAQTLTTPGSTVWCNAMLERGITATLGPVEEPYLLAFPLPDDFFSLLLTGRYTLVETYYRTCPFMSWVMVLVGDPLYNPFQSKPQLAENQLPERLRPKAPPSVPGLESSTVPPAEGPKVP
jgi:uncharacterized protein (TIGR03790 family)